ncbi:hypothetical protein DITRI_Ditri07aG0071300 [Diplodiscus trichospermus]
MEGSPIRTLENICVFCGANYGKDEIYVKSTYRLGEVLGKKGINLIYGGGSLGLMGCMSTAAAVHGKRVSSIVPSTFTEKNLIGKTCGKELKVATMHEWLLKMMEFGDAFITLLGGFGTLEELFQIVSRAQLNVHHKPIGVVSVNGFFDNLLSFLDHTVEQNFITQLARQILISASTAEELIDKLQTFHFELDPTTSQLKWPIESN